MAETVNTNQFKNGMHIELEGQPWRIVEFQHVKPGKGGAFVRTKLKALASGAVVDRTFRAGEKFPRVHTETKNVQYLYDDGSEVHFMDSETYEQFALPHGDLEDELPFMQPNATVQVLAVNGKDVKDEYDVLRIIFNHSVGESVHFLVQRNDKRQLEFELPLEEYPGPAS